MEQRLKDSLVAGPLFTGSVLWDHTDIKQTTVWLVVGVVQLWGCNSSFWMILLQWINLLDYQLFPLNLHIWFTIIKPLRLVFSGSLEAVSSWKSISFPLQSWKFITYSQSVPCNVWIKSLNEFDSYRSSPVMTAHCNQLQRASMNDLQTDVRGRTSTEILWEDLLIVSVENKNAKFASLLSTRRNDRLQRTYRENGKTS